MEEATVHCGVGNMPYINIIGVRFFMLVICTQFLGCESQFDYQLIVNKSESLTEHLAILCSKEALKAYGINLTGLISVKHRDVESGFFVRNTKDDNNGYTLWHKNGKKTLYEYIVDVTKVESVISCKVTQAK